VLYFKGANFTDAIISGCIFTNNVKNLTVEQIKSTWNYKVGRMDGIKLPPDIQKALDAEKKDNVKLSTLTLP
jgi:O-phosphoseryl-tRNA(Cys) synthetase